MGLTLYPIKLEKPPYDFAAALGTLVAEPGADAAHLVDAQFHATGEAPCRSRDRASLADHEHLSALHDRGRAPVLRRRHRADVAPRRVLRGENPAWCKTLRLAGRAGLEFRARGEPQDRQGARHHALPT